MRRFLLIFCAGLVAAATAAPSFAADIIQRPVFKAPMYVAPLFTWSGFYVGVNTGYGFGSSIWTGGGLGTGSFNTKGWLGGGTLGYNMQSGSWVWGLEGDIDYSSIKGSHACAAGTCTTRNDWLGTVRGRVGYAFDRFMIYGTGGGAIGDVKMSNSAAGSETDVKFGWSAGAGVEWAFLGAWSAKLEYLYVDLGKANCTAANCGAAADVKFHSSLVRGGLNYRF